MCLCVHAYESESVFVCACMRVCGVCCMCVYVCAACACMCVPHVRVCVCRMCVYVCAACACMCVPHVRVCVCRMCVYESVHSCVCAVMNANKWWFAFSCYFLSGLASN